MSYFSNNRYVKELSPDDFDKNEPWKLKDDACGLVLFYAPWCGHCKNVKPEWDAAAKQVGFCDYYAFNCDAHKDYVSKNNNGLVNGYPTIIIYKKGKPAGNYDGNRDRQSFIKACMGTCKT